MRSPIPSGPPWRIIRPIRRVAAVPKPQEPSPIQVYVPVQEAFPGTEPSEEALIELLSSFSRDGLICHWAILNRIQTGYGEGDADTRDRYMVENTCTRETLGRIMEFGQRRRDNYFPHIYARGQLLEAIRWSARYGSDAPARPEDFGTEDAKDRLVKAALIAMDIWAKRTLGTLHDGTKIEEVLGKFRRTMEGNGHAPIFEFMVGRGAELFTRYMPQRYPDFLKDFEKATSMSLDTYLACSIGLSLYAMNYKGNLPSVFNRSTVGSQSKFNDELMRYIDLYSLTPGQMTEALWTNFEKNDFKALRERPIAALPNDLAVIVDPIFYIERISIGPLFLVAGLSV